MLKSSPVGTAAWLNYLFQDFQSPVGAIFCAVVCADEGNLLNRKIRFIALIVAESPEAHVLSGFQTRQCVG